MRITGISAVSSAGYFRQGQANTPATTPSTTVQSEAVAPTAQEQLSAQAHEIDRRAGGERSDASSDAIPSGNATNIPSTLL
jgi:hypothetical protein